MSELNGGAVARTTRFPRRANLDWNYSQNTSRRILSNAFCLFQPRRLRFMNTNGLSIWIALSRSASCYKVSWFAVSFHSFVLSLRVSFPRRSVFLEAFNTIGKLVGSGIFELRRCKTIQVFRADTWQCYESSHRRHPRGKSKERESLAGKFIERTCHFGFAMPPWSAADAHSLRQNNYFQFSSYQQTLFPSVLNLLWTPRQQNTSHFGSLPSVCAAPWCRHSVEGKLKLEV